MPTLPRATSTVTETVTGGARGTELICVLTPAALNADCKPRLFGSADAVYAQHGYCEGVEYASLHVDGTSLPVLVCALPIDTVGVISRQNTAGNTGTCVTTVTAGVSGVLAEHDGSITVKRGGTIGTDQIELDVSLDGGFTSKTVRLGTGNSYALPLVGATVAFGAGTLVTGDVIHTWHGTGPRAASASITTARGYLAAQMKLFRSALLCGDVPDAAAALAFAAELDAFASSNDRFAYGRASIPDRSPQAALSKIVARMTGSPTLTFAEVGATGDTITRSAGSWLTDGFAIGDTVTVAGSASNNITGVIANLNATVITLDNTDLVAEGPVSNCTVVAYPTLTFAEVGASADTITRNRGSWLADGFRTGDTITVTGTSSNNVTGTLANVSATVLTMGTTDLAPEVISTNPVTLTAGQTAAAWMAAQEAAYSTVDGKPLLDLSAGRGAAWCSFAGRWIRRPAGWAASVREYQHDLHRSTWYKADGPVGWLLSDADGEAVEWDDRPQGGAGTQARFTTFRTWSNGPDGAFIAMSQTRATDGSVRALTNNVAVINLARTVVQTSAENVVGRVLTLTADGTATKDAIAAIESEVNAALARELLADTRKEGPRASIAIWAASRDDNLSGATARLTGNLRLKLNGTIHDVFTSIKVS